jgi:hypothetical protein
MEQHTVQQVQETKEEEARRLKMERLEREANEEVNKSQAAGPLKMDIFKIRLLK